METLGIDKGTYSIRYSSKEVSPPVESAVDWDWIIKGQWACSERDGPGGRWMVKEGLDEEARRIIIKHFGLEQLANKSALNRLLVMSPRELTKMRRKIESEAGLEPKEIRSDTIGYHVEAEMHI